MDAAVVHRAGDGPGTWAMRSLFEHLVGADDTDGRLGVSLVVQPPGVATPFHRHTQEGEALFVLDGQVDYRAGDDRHLLEEGAFLWLPLGVPHAFRIRGDRPARFLALTVPGGLMGLYDEVGVPATHLGLPGKDEGLGFDTEVARWTEVGPRYGLEVVGPPIPV